MDIKKVRFQQVAILPPPSPQILLFNTDRVVFLSFFLSFFFFFFFFQGGNTGGSPKLGLSGWIRSLFGSQAVLWSVCAGSCLVPAGSALSLSSRSTADPMTSFSAVGLVGEL